MGKMAKVSRSPWEDRPMARKKRKPGGRGPSRRRPVTLGSLPDRRAMEGVMREAVRSLQGEADQDTPLGQAQTLLYRAFEEPDEQRRVHLANEALAVCPDCADAYVLLAEHARSRKEALALYEKGMAAGERAAQGGMLSSGMSAIFGACSKPGRTCVPDSVWPTPCGPLAAVTRPCNI